MFCGDNVCISFIIVNLNPFEIDIGFEKEMIILIQIPYVLVYVSSQYET